ncbi:MAG TPA: helix-turn-helix transcriptional regulator [Gemmatimonadaceae bacterium]|nr:helix-turn-helix transcriptional regulator [Gemmatimonadaceae bacterium]
MVRGSPTIHDGVSAHSSDTAKVSSLIHELVADDLARLGYDVIVIAVRRHDPVLTAEATHGKDSARLTARERQVARELARGHSNQQIAGALGLSVHTVRRHTERVLRKLGVRSRHAVAERLRAGQPI